MTPPNPGDAISPASPTAQRMVSRSLSPRSDNYLLLDKMSYIMTHPQLLDEKYMGPPVTYGKSLNKEYRKKELMRITEENQQILRRIQHKEPHYSHETWTEQVTRAPPPTNNLCSCSPILWQDPYLREPQTAL